MQNTKVIIRVQFEDDNPPPPANAASKPVFVATLKVVSRVAGSGAVRKIA